MTATKPTLRCRLVIEPQQGYETLRVVRESLLNGFQLYEIRANPTVEDVLQAVGEQLAQDLPRRTPAEDRRWGVVTAQESDQDPNGDTVEIHGPLTEAEAADLIRETEEYPGWYAYKAPWRSTLPLVS